MDSYDFLMIGVLVVTTLHGAWKGMAWQLAAIAALVLSYYLAMRFSTQMAPLFGLQEPLNRFVAMFVIYIGTSLTVWILFHIVSDFMNRLRLQEFDRQVGALFGAAKGVLLCVAITFFALSLMPTVREPILQSRSGYYIALLIDRANTIMPPEIHQVLDPYLNRLQQELKSDPAKPSAAKPT